MTGLGVKVIIAFIVVALHDSYCRGAQNYKEEFYNSIDVLNKVANVILRVEHFPPLRNDTNLRAAVRPICPLLDRHLEIEEYILSGNTANITEMKAAEVILEHVLNDTCNWIQSLPQMSNFVCTSNYLVGLQSLCIEMRIKDIANDQRGRLLNLYSHEDQVKRYSHRANKEWIAATYSGRDADEIDQVLFVIKKYSSGFKNCNRQGNTVSCP